MLGKSSKPQWLKVFYIDLAKPKSGARIVFSPHNLSRPGLEPGSSNSEPSALITGLLNKAVVLACPQYSWPRMSKVAPCTVVRSYNRIFSAWWFTTILYNFGATLCELRYDLKFFLPKGLFFPNDYSLRFLSSKGAGTWRHQQRTRRDCRKLNVN